MRLTMAFYALSATCLVLLAVISDTDAAGTTDSPVALGAKCSPMPVDTCNSTTQQLLCDKTLHKCLIQANQTCTGKEDKCVSGATCQTASKMCSCQNNYKLKDDFTCEKIVALGGACTKQDSCGTADGSGPDLHCDEYSSKCVLKVGQPCTSAQSCPTGGVCKSGKCACNEPTYHSNHGVCAKVVVNVGSACMPGDICRPTDQTLHVKCDKAAGRCLLEIGTTCKGNTAMCRTGGVCNTTTSMCACAGIYTSNGDTCSAAQGKVTGLCNTGDVCGTANAYCDDDGHCLCNPGYAINSTDATCVKGGSGPTGGAGAVAVNTAVIFIFNLMAVCSTIKFHQV